MCRVVERVCTGAGCVCVCICRPVAAAACHLWFPQAHCGSKQSHWADRSWGLWLRGRGLQPGRTAALSKLLLTPATERTNCLIVLFSAPSFHCTLQVRARGSAAFQAPGRSSNICNTKPLDCTNTPLVRIELFSSCVFFGGAAMINMLRGDHLSISGQKTLHTLIRIISAKLREETETFRRLMEERGASSFAGQMGWKPTAFIISLIQFQAQ